MMLQFQQKVYNNCFINLKTNSYEFNLRTSHYKYKKIYNNKMGVDIDSAQLKLKYKLTTTVWEQSVTPDQLTNAVNEVNQNLVQFIRAMQELANNLRTLTQQLNQTNFMNQRIEVFRNNLLRNIQGEEIEREEAESQQPQESEQQQQHNLNTRRQRGRIDREVSTIRRERHINEFQSSELRILQRQHQAVLIRRRELLRELQNQLPNEGMTLEQLLQVLGSNEAEHEQQQRQQEEQQQGGIFRSVGNFFVRSLNDVYQWIAYTL